MKSSLECRHSRKSSLLFLSLALLAFSFASLGLSELGFVLTPIVSVLIAAVYIVEVQGKHILSYLYPPVLIAAELIIFRCHSFNFVFSTLVAAILVCYYYFGYLNRTEAAAFTTVLISLSIGLLLFFELAVVVNSFDMTVMKEHCFELIENGKVLFLEATEQYVFTDSNGEVISLIDPKLASALYDATVALIPAFIVIMGFALAGACLKAFSFVVYLLFSSDALDKLGRFDPSIIFAYFYVCLSFVSVFLDASNAFGVALLNLNSIFTAVYAYVGFMLFSTLLGAKFGRGVGILIASGAVLLTLLSGFGLQLIAVFGSVLSIMIKRRLSRIDKGAGDNKN